MTVWVGITSFNLAAGFIIFMARISSSNITVRPVKGFSICLYFIINIYFIVSVQSQIKSTKRRNNFQMEILHTSLQDSKLSKNHEFTNVLIQILFQESDPDRRLSHIHQPPWQRLTGKRQWWSLQGCNWTPQLIVRVMMSSSCTWMKMGIRELPPIWLKSKIDIYNATASRLRWERCIFCSRMYQNDKDKKCLCLKMSYFIMKLPTSTL